MASGGSAIKREEDEYTFDKFDDGSNKMVAENQMTKLRKFVDDYSSQLHQIEEALDESLSEVWDATVDPISLDLEPYEQTTILDLVKTDNKLFNKLVVIFASLSAEVQQLRIEAEQKIYPPLILFGELIEISEGDAQVQVAKLLPFLSELPEFILRCYQVAQNIVRQLASLYHPRSKLWANSFKNIHLTSIFESLGELLTILVTLDAIITQNENFKQSWAMYKRMMKNAKLEVARYNVTEDQLNQFEKVVQHIEVQFEGYIFNNVIHQDFDFPGLIEVTTNTVFRAEFVHNIVAILDKLQPPKDETGKFLVTEPSSFVGLCALYALYANSFKIPPEKHLFKSLWDMYRRYPIVHLWGRAVFFSTTFLDATCPQLVKQLGGSIAKEVASFAKDYIAKLDEKFDDRVKLLQLQVSLWMVWIESNLANRAEIAKILNTRIDLMYRGLKLATEISELFRTSIYMHIHFNVPIQVKSIRSHCMCVEMLKAIQFTFHRRSAMIGESISYMIQQNSFHLQKAFLPVKHKLEKEKKYSDAKLDVLAAISLGMSMLNGSGSRERRILLRIAMQIVFQEGYQKDKDQETGIQQQVEKLETVACFQEKITRVCDCQFFFWSREMLPVYLGDIYKSPSQAYKLKYMMAALTDIVPVFRKAIHIEGDHLTEKFSDDVYKQLKECIIDTLCRDIETDLRFHIHSHLEVSVRDPFKQGVRDLQPFLVVRPLRLFNRTVDMRAIVTHYLDQTFYNLNTVALYDWQTYAEMRNLAKEKYSLELSEVHLPSQTLDQGLDVLEIMRNIHVFVSRYNYNLNSQFFIERSADSKSLNTINIQHISNSVRTHGLGIINTTVNFTYQYLRQKFFVFSQFLFDDHIKSRLHKDIRFFKENKEKLSQMYPFERAEKFNREIRKLGMTDKGLTYLDQFRILITEIGNAMGYIRMMRAGAMNFTANAIKFVPDLKDIPKFQERVEPEGLSAETVSAAKTLDAVTDNLAKSFAEGTEYFQMLVNVFATEFRSAANLHLRNFYIIVPPLTLNFVEHTLLSKEKLTKKNVKEGLAFCDDGFPIGVAYILKLLDQTRDFDAVHWFGAVAKKYKDEINKLNAAAMKTDKKEEQQSNMLTKNRMRNYQMEFELLKYSFSGARIFFRDSDKKKDEKTNEEKKEGDANNANNTPAPPGAADAPPPPPPRTDSFYNVNNLQAIPPSVPPSRQTSPTRASGGPPPPPPPPPR